MASNSAKDYAALIKAAKLTQDCPVDWLKQGETIISKTYGVGTVVGFIGTRLVVNFLSGGSNLHIDFPNWQDAISSKEIYPKESMAFSNSDKDLQAKILSISCLPFRNIALELQPSLASVQTIASSAGELYPLPFDLHPNLINAFTKIGIKNFYSHQTMAREALKDNKDIIIATPTASGKTLCYNPTIFQDCLTNSNLTALYIFPLKALANDQLDKLHQINQALPFNQKLKIALMTGDIVAQERIKLFSPRYPQLLAVSPDLLHYHLYKTKEQIWENWRLFLINLKYIVVDEAHSYIGSFGIHFANLIRRLLLAVDRVGGMSEKIQFIFSSATIGNPQDLALSFSNRDSTPERLQVIDKSGASTAERTILALSPSSTTNIDACKIIASCLRHNLSIIVFCNSRDSVKSLFMLLQEQLTKENKKQLIKTIAIFYGSILGDKRQQIIEKLRSGELKVILSTSALEAGIDLPQLDCCLIKGYPGSLMSFRQRIGRVGRNRPGLVIYLPQSSNTLDFYYGQNPYQLLESDVETTSCNPNYPTILSKHIECGCVESGIAIKDLTKHFGTIGGNVANFLLKEQKLTLYKSGMIYAKGYPHKEVNLRSNQIGSILLIDKDTNETIEEMSKEIAFREVFPGAIYATQNDQGEIKFYYCEKLDLELNKASLIAYSKDPEMKTKPTMQTHIKVLSSLMEPLSISTKIAQGNLELELVWGEITLQVNGFNVYTRNYTQVCGNSSCKNYYKEVDSSACSHCGKTTHHGETSKPTKEIYFNQPYETKYQAPIISIKVNKALAKGIEAKVEQIKGQINKTYAKNVPEQLRSVWQGSAVFIALHSLEHQINAAIPLLVLCSSRDVNGLCIKDDEESSKSIAYLFDTSDGGNGACEAIFERFGYFTQKAKELAETCDCLWGCPRCLFRHACPHDNEALHKQVGLFLLNSLNAK